MTITKARRKLDLLYARVPRMDCRQLCGHCCESFLVGKVEWDRVMEAGKPQLVSEVRCPMLVEGGCSVHQVRPMLCRLWYTREDKRCPHGCVPERWLTQLEWQSLLDSANKISRGDVGFYVETDALQVRVQAAVGHLIQVLTSQ